MRASVIAWFNSMTGALAPRTRSGATYGSGAAAPSTPVRGPALRLVDPEDAALRRASADVPYWPGMV